MLSRLANSFFWMERYRERAENIARLIDVNLNLNLDLPQNANRQWAPLVHTTGDWDLFESKYEVADEKNVLEFLTFDTGNPNSILSCLAQARLNAQSIRQTLTTDMWSELNTLYLFVSKAASQKRSTKSAYEFFTRIKRHCNLFTGIFEVSMTHDEAWHFGRMGSLLERADQTSRLIDIKYFILLPSVDYVGTPYDDILWAALLKSASGFEMYRRRWGQIHPRHLLEFLVLDTQFPRSIDYCITEAEKSLRAISNGEQERSDPEKRLDQLKNHLQNLQAEEIISDGVHEFMTIIKQEISAISNGINTVFFDTSKVITPKPKQMQIQAGRKES